MNKKIIISLAIIGVVAAIAVGGTVAYFTDTETSTGNTFTAGAIDLTIDNTSYYDGVFSEGTSWLQPKNLETGDLFFNFSDLKPGDWGEDTISFHVNNNDAWLCADITLTADDDNGITEPEEEAGDTTDGVGQGELADQMHFFWWADDGDNVFEQGEEAFIVGGTLADAEISKLLTSTLVDSENNFWGEDGALSGGKTYYIAMMWCFGDIIGGTTQQDGLGYTTRLLPASTASKAADKGSGLITIPAPPPYGASSQVLCRSSAYCRKSIIRPSMLPFSSDLAIMEVLKNPSTISGKRVNTVNFIQESN